MMGRSRTELLLLAAIAVSCAVPAAAQQVTGTPGSPSATTTIDGKQLPPTGAPNIMLAAGGTQLRKVLEDDGIYVWSFHVDWSDPAKTKVEGPTKIPVAPYHYLCDGQLTSCVPQPGVDRRLDGVGPHGCRRLPRLAVRRAAHRDDLRRRRRRVAQVEQHRQLQAPRRQT